MKKLFMLALAFLLSFTFFIAEGSAASRLKGADRYETAVNISKNGWSQADTVVLAIGNNFPDALAGGPLAYKLNAPILLSQKDTLGKSTITEIQRLKPKKAIILGSVNVITKKVETELKSLGLTFTRLGGKDRYETAAIIAAQLGKTDKAVVAYGMNFPDALAIAPYAAQKGYPILLSKTNELPDPTKKELNGKKETIFVGGKSILSDAVIKQAPNGKRISGADRFDTAAAIIKQYQPDASNAYVATGMNFADALTGSVLAAKKNGAMVLVNPKQVPKAMTNLLSVKTFVTVVSLGGEGAVSNAVLQKIEELNVNDTIQKAAPIKVNTGYTLQTTEYQSDYFKVTLAKPGNVTVQFKQNADHYWEGEMIDKDGKVYLDFRTEDGSSIDNFTNKSVGLPAGVFYFKVNGINDSYKVPYTFTINYEDSNYYEKELNNTLASSSPVELNKDYKGIIQDVYNDTDYYKFTLDQPGNVELKVDNKSGSRWDAVIMDGNGKEYGDLETISGSSASGTSNFNIGLPKGTYYVQVNNGSEQVEYKFHLKYTKSNFYEKEFNDNTAAANSIELNQYYTGNIENYYNDVDYFRLTLKEAGNISVNVKQKPGSRWYVAVMNSSGTDLASFETAGNDYASGETAIPVGLPAGDYYIEIRNGAEREPYQFKVNFTAGDSFEKEINDNVQTANKIELNKTYQGSLSSKYNDSDFYYFQVEKQSNFIIKMKNQSNASWYYVITDQYGKEIADLNTDYDEFAKGEESVNLNLKAGKYYIRVTDHHSSIFIPYTFSMNKQ
ncbi:cell wall-binding repeat-containing protein [Metabacillus idriensis]|uniref:cell wall-binding repeat-containing protein n=1 Tax=Metabacillus idriensis TaxID=324768 RepID=UPI003D2B321D